MEMWCTRCKSSAGRTNGRYCFMCGLLLADTQPSCSCGRQLHSADRFCEDCGAVTDKGKEEGLAAQEKCEAAQSTEPRYEQAEVEAWR